MAKKVITQEDKDKFKEFFGLELDDYWQGDYTHLNYDKFKVDTRVPETLALKDWLSLEQFTFLVRLF